MRGRSPAGRRGTRRPRSPPGSLLPTMLEMIGVRRRKVISTVTGATVAGSHCSGRGPSAHTAGVRSTVVRSTSSMPPLLRSARRHRRRRHSSRFAGMVRRDAGHLLEAFGPDQPRKTRPKSMAVSIRSRRTGTTKAQFHDALATASPATTGHHKQSRHQVPRRIGTKVPVWCHGDLSRHLTGGAAARRA